MTALGAVIRKGFADESPQGCHQPPSDIICDVTPLLVTALGAVIRYFASGLRAVFLWSGRVARAARQLIRT